MSYKIVGLLIAGGKSRRFGSPKAFLKKDGKYFYEYSIDALKKITDSIVIVTSRELQPLFLEIVERYPIITDKIEYKEMGPLSGLYSGMDYIVGDWYMIAPIDSPFISYPVFLTLISQQDEQFDAIVPEVSGVVQPLFAMYHSRIKQKLLHQLKKEQLSFKDLFANMRVKYVKMDNKVPFYNINRKADYEKWIGPSLKE